MKVKEQTLEDIKKRLTNISNTYGYAATITVDKNRYMVIDDTFVRHFTSLRELDCFLSGIVSGIKNNRNVTLVQKQCGILYKKVCSKETMPPALPEAIQYINNSLLFSNTDAKFFNEELERLVDSINRIAK